MGSQEGLALLKADYKTEDEARQKIPEQLTQFYRNEHPEVLAQHPDLVKAAGAGTGARLHDERVSGYEGDVGNASQPHRAHELSGMLPLP